MFRDLWAIDLPDCKAWRQVEETDDFPPARIGHSAVAVGNRILIFGGRNFKSGKKCNSSLWRVPFLAKFSRGGVVVALVPLVSRNWDRAWTIVVLRELLWSCVNCCCGLARTPA